MPIPQLLVCKTKPPVKAGLRLRALHFGRTGTYASPAEERSKPAAEGREGQVGLVTSQAVMARCASAGVSSLYRHCLLLGERGCITIPAPAENVLLEAGLRLLSLLDCEAPALQITS